MFTYSLCMIVKNESAILSRCLDSFSPYFNEIIVVDTGSDDNTKEIARRYTDKVYDFTWQDDFSAARNFAFSKCTCDYIYSCDADEILDEENGRRLALLMEAMLPEVEIVQMKYVEEQGSSTVLNFKKELRPKLFKRQRQFTWIDPVHERIRLEPVVFDSDIEILHKPSGSHHSKRDFTIFKKAYSNSVPFSDNMYSMYARELYKHGSAEDLADARDIFLKRISEQNIDEDSFLMSQAVLCRCFRLNNDEVSLLKHALTASELVHDICSEIAYELGLYYQSQNDLSPAIYHYNRAAYDTAPLLNVHTGGDLPLNRLAECCEDLGEREKAADFRLKASNWQLPEGD